MERSPLDSRQIRLGLDRPQRLLAALGNPHRSFPSILIAGTNGKGSTAALLTSILHHAGYRVGWFRSPALESDRDQIGIGTEQISAATFEELGEKVAKIGRKTLGDDPTPFEALTAVAFLHFGQGPVDLAVIEAGMGGARDATNVVDPILSIVTSVALEHTDFLGRTVQEIAREKAGVFRPKRHALASSTSAGPAWEALIDEAVKIGAHLHDTAWEATARGEHDALTVTTDDDIYRVSLPLAGDHQCRNLVLAVRAAELLRPEGWGDIDHEAIRDGVAATRLPGRLETFHLPDDLQVLLDAAHNPAAVKALAKHLDSLREHDPARRIHLLFGVLQDKAAEMMLPPLVERVDRVTLTRPPGGRGRAAEDLMAWAGPAAEIANDPERALDHALDALPEGGLLLVTGSLSLVGALRPRLTADR